MSSPLWSAVGWIVAASVLGFGISGIFAGWLRLSRNRFLLAYVPITGVFLYTFVIANQIDLIAALAHNWVFGILLGALTSLFLVRHVNSQPASRQAAGSRLVFDISWAGLAYGVTDALLLNVLPVAAVWVGFQSANGSAAILGKIGLGLAGLLASLLVTLAYHLGYPEFRNRSVLKVLVGNSLITLAFLLSGSPLGSIISHAAMHVAAVLHGPETTLQLPPHHQVMPESS